MNACILTVNYIWLTNIFDIKNVLKFDQYSIRDKSMDISDYLLLGRLVFLENSFIFYITDVLEI